MDLLHVIPSIAPDHGGPSRSVPLLVQALRDQGLNVTLAAGGSSDANNVSLEHRKIPGEILTDAAKKKLSKAISEANLVEIHSLWNGTSSWTAAACRHVGVPYVLTPRGMLDPLCVANHVVSKWVYPEYVCV